MKKRVILLGASTGGPSQIKEMLKAIKNLNCTIVVVQHMQEEILPFFIKDLKDSLSHKVLISPSDYLFCEPCIVVCSHTSVLKKSFSSFSIVTDKASQVYTPDINKLFKSFVPYALEFDMKVIIMTGIGDDGVAGAKELKKLGAKIIAEDEKSCPVYGMPRVAIESGIVDEVKTHQELIECFKDIKWAS
jgi:two-component system chemotaxis response regulator CheB